MNYEMQTTGI